MISAITGLKGPYILSWEEIGRTVQRASPGVFVLGTFETVLSRPSIVGRSDTDLAKRLLAYTGFDTHFGFSLCPSAEVAFLAECELFHDLQPAFSLLHPELPEGYDLQCPRCAKLSY
jgi:hypothetical protein